MIGRTSLQVRTEEWGLTEEVVEKDYVLGWVLAGIGGHPVLSNTWVFKGGTCLKKCYIETYRFSEDLDFTVVDDGPLEPDDLMPVLIELLDTLEQESGLRLTSRPPVVRMRPDGRSAEGRIYYVGPRAGPEARIKLDLTYDELVVEPPVARPIAHAYDDSLPEPATVRAYTFAELFAEKLRALGQRTRPRDLYDVVNLYRRADVSHDREVVSEILAEKCRFKGIPVPTEADVTEPGKVADLRADWTAMLAHQLPALPSVDDFLATVGQVFRWLAGEEAPALEPVPVPARDQIEETWVAPPTITRWPGAAPLEQIRFAGNNHLLVDLHYQGSRRLIEPYSLRRSRAGNLLVYAVKHQTGEIRAYRVDRIQGVRITETPFRPRYAIELSAVLPVASGPRLGARRPRPGARGPRPGRRRR